MITIILFVVRWLINEMGVERRFNWVLIGSFFFGSLASQRSEEELYKLYVEFLLAFPDTFESLFVDIYVVLVLHMMKRLRQRQLQSMLIMELQPCMYHP